MGKSQRRKWQKINKSFIHSKSIEIEQELIEGWKAAIREGQSGVIHCSPIEDIDHLRSAIFRLIRNPQTQGWRFLEINQQSGKFCWAIIVNEKVGEQNWEEVIRAAAMSRQSR